VHGVAWGIRAWWIVLNATATPTGGRAAISVGGHKQSGIGTEGGVQGFEAYMSSTTVRLPKWPRRRAQRVGSLAGAIFSLRPPSGNG
jgi:acyl-CoA reductase-like NAD-dependent aldehyde dehydrogenase